MLDLHNNLLFLPERMKTEKVKKFAADLHNKKEYALVIKYLKKALNHRLVLKKVHRLIKLNQKAWIKSYIDRTKELRKNVKSEFEKCFLKLMNRAGFWKTMKCKES